VREVDLQPDESYLPAPPSALAPGTLVGEYRVEHKLGEGGMATVYAAIHPLIGKRAAIKVMSPKLSVDTASVARFALEARAVNRIGHPNIVDVFSFGRLPDGRSYFVMEWLQGETLYERMWRQHGPMPLVDFIHIIDQICDALEAAHDKEIVHRDLKPANIFLCPVRGRPDRVKLLDFGVAKLAQPGSPRWTSAGSVVGTPEYVSPEQARGRDVDARADIYSLGVIAYEMVLGRQPFLSDNSADAIQMHLMASPPRPSILWPDIPPALETLLLRLLCKDPDGRPSLAEVRATLAALQPTATATTTTTPRRRAAALAPWRRLRRRHVARVGAVAATFLCLAFASYHPVQLRAQKLHVVAPPRVQTAHAGPRAPSAASPETGPTIAPADKPAPRDRSTTRRGRKIRRDANYLLDPFAH
jgi:eukaryotic-like serine/threonine-protein kinase